MELYVERPLANEGPRLPRPPCLNPCQRITIGLPCQRITICLRARIAIASSLCWLAFGCAPSIQAAAKDATQGAAPVAVRESIKSLDEPETRARILDLMSSPEMQKAVQDLASAAITGAAQAVDNQQLAAKTAQLSSGIAALVTRTVVDSALTELSSPVAERRLEQIVGAAADAAARSSARALADELPSTIGPALTAAIQSGVAPGARALLSSPEVQSALSQTAYEMSRQAVLGSNAGLAELEQKKNKSGSLARVSGWLANGGWLLAGGAVIALGIISVLVVIMRRTRHLRGNASQKLA